MEIYVNGKAVTLSQKDFVAKGGEGKIFQRGGLAYKVYDDLTKMIPPAKIGELNIPDPNVIKPLDLIINREEVIENFNPKDEYELNEEDNIPDNIPIIWKR